LVEDPVARAAPAPPPSASFAPIARAPSFAKKNAATSASRRLQLVLDPARRAAATRQRIKSTIPPARNVREKTRRRREFAGLATDGSFASNKRTYSYDAHAAYVAVDPKTGHVALIDYVAAEDIGRIINPLTLHGQYVGAVVQGLGGAFLEHFIYDENGQLLTAHLPTT